MKKINNLFKRSSLFLIFLLFSGIHLFAQNPLTEWARHVGGPNDQAATAVTTDSSGNVYYTGFFEDTINFNPGVGISLLPTKHRTVFIAKLNAKGEFVWAKHFEGVNNNGQIGQGFGVKTDPWGNVYASGYYGGTINFDQFTLTSTRGSDIFVTKLDSLGNVIWIKSMGGSPAIAYGMDVDKYGNVYTTGEFSGTVDFDPGPGIENITSKGGIDVFISKLDSAGNYVWAKGIGGTGQDYCYAISVDPFGNVYTSGNFDKPIDLNPDPNNTFIINPVGNSEAFISKLDSMGNFVWGKRFAGLTSNSSTRSHTIKADRFGNIFTAGQFYRSIDFNAGGNTSFPVTGAGSSSHLYTAKLDSTGNLIWVKYSIANITPRSLDVDDQGNPYMAGWYNSTAEFNPGTGVGDTFKVTAVKSNDIFILKLDSAGAFQWAKSFGGDGADYGYAICVDKKRSIYAAGYFNSNQINFDTLLNDANFTNKGKLDIFVLKINQSCTDSSFSNIDIDICEDEYVFDDKTFQNSGVYTFSYINEAGCDSIITLNLTLKGAIQKPAITINEFVLGTTPQNYSSYQWYFNGNMLPGATDSTIIVTENGNYHVVVTNKNGCEETSEIYKVTNVTGIDQTSEEQQILVYPNPANQVVYIKTGFPINAQVYGIDGRLLINTVKTHQINLESLSPGIYYLKIYNKNGLLLKSVKLLKSL